MKSLKITFLLAALFYSMIACNNSETATVTKTPIPTDTTTQATTDSVIPEPVPVLEIQGDRTTLEGFWKIVQVAVANEDKEILTQLSVYRAGATSLVEDRYAPLVAKIKVTDFKESSREENGQKLYEYTMIMNYPEEELIDGEQPGAIIYIWKKEDGNFEIFDIFEPG